MSDLYDEGTQSKARITGKEPLAGTASAPKYPARKPQK